MTTPKTQALIGMMALGQALAHAGRDGRNDEPRSIGDILRDALESQKANQSTDLPTENFESAMAPNKSFLDWALEAEGRQAADAEAEGCEECDRVIAETKALTPEQLSAGVMTEAMHGPAAQSMEAKFFIDKMLANPVSQESISTARVLVGFCASAVTPLEQSIGGEDRYFGECKREQALALLRELIGLGFHTLMNVGDEGIDYLMVGMEGHGLTDHTIVRVSLPMDREQSCGLMIVSSDDVRPLFGSIFTADNIE